MYKHQVYWIIVWVLLLIGTNAQKLPQSLNGGQDEFNPSDTSDEELDSRQSVDEGDVAAVSEAPPITIPTLSFHDPSDKDDQPPDAQESQNNDTPQAMASLVFIGGEDEFNPLDTSDEELDSRQSVGEDDVAAVSEAPLVTIPTLSFHESSDNDDQPPDAQESQNNDTPQAMASLVFIAAIVALCVVGCVAFVGGMFCWYKHTGMVTSARRVLYRSSDSSVLIHNGYQPMSDEVNGHVTTNNNTSRLAEKTDYPAYGVTGPNPLHYSKGPPIDVNLNRSAEVFHYQQQKQRLKSLNSTSSNSQSPDGSRSHATTTDQEDDEENSDGEYTVYECPGLASTTDGPLEIHNPLFTDADTFSSYSTSSLGGSIVTSAYSTTVGGKG